MPVLNIKGQYLKSSSTLPADSYFSYLGKVCNAFVNPMGAKENPHLYHVVEMSSDVVLMWQVLAVVFRPKKDSNTRKYWNWYHWWVGRLALFLACINVFVGLNLSNGERKLRVSYIVLLAFELVAFAILETIYWVRWNRAPANSSGVRWNRASTERGFQMSDY